MPNGRGGGRRGRREQVRSVVREIPRENSLQTVVGAKRKNPEQANVSIEHASYLGLQSLSSLGCAKMENRLTISHFFLHRLFLFMIDGRVKVAETVRRSQFTFKSLVSTATSAILTAFSFSEKIFFSTSHDMRVVTDSASSASVVTDLDDEDTIVIHGGVHRSLALFAYFLGIVPICVQTGTAEEEAFAWHYFTKADEAVTKAGEAEQGKCGYAFLEVELEKNGHGFFGSASRKANVKALFERLKGAVFHGEGVSNILVNIEGTVRFNSQEKIPYNCVDSVSENLKKALKGDVVADLLYIGKSDKFASSVVALSQSARPESDCAKVVAKFPTLSVNVESACTKLSGSLITPKNQFITTEDTNLALLHAVSLFVLCSEEGKSMLCYNRMWLVNYTLRWLDSVKNIEALRETHRLATLNSERMWMHFSNLVNDRIDRVSLKRSTLTRALENPVCVVLTCMYLKSQDLDKCTNVFLKLQTLTQGPFKNVKTFYGKVKYLLELE